MPCPDRLEFNEEGMWSCSPLSQITHWCSVLVPTFSYRYMPEWLSAPACVLTQSVWDSLEYV